ncbi:hypothetical protein ACP70R_019865 [Stipagrostis hirtigluma subsp. patula]
MERKGGCCLAPRYGAAAGGQAWQMGRLMLKFRPIAPKPAAMASVPSPAPATAAGAGRGKRKAAGGGGGRRGRKPKKAATVAPAPAAPMVAAAQVVGDMKESEKDKSLSSRSSSSSGMTSVDSSPPPPLLAPPATLPLMPVSPVEEKSAAAADEPAAVATAHDVGGHIFAPRALRPAAACFVTVEDVTTTWRDGEAPSTATPRPGDDEAPAFASDQWGRVTWTNTSFRRAVSAADDRDAFSPAEVQVSLAARALPAWGTCAGFTCRVRVHHASPRRGGGGSLVAPCDVWRLDVGGCYLWRLDLQAALTLGCGLP